MSQPEKKHKQIAMHNKFANLQIFLSTISCKFIFIYLLFSNVQKNDDKQQCASICKLQMNKQIKKTQKTRRKTITKFITIFLVAFSSNFFAWAAKKYPLKTTLINLIVARFYLLFNRLWILKQFKPVYPFVYIVQQN